MARTIEITGGRTLADLHEVIFVAFDRDDEHMYEFQIGGKRPMDPKARRYVLPMAMEAPFDDDEVEGDVTRTTLESLRLKRGDVFAYWFDFGDDWWHRIEVLAIREGGTRRTPPRVTARTVESPPQYMDWDGEA